MTTLTTTTPHPMLNTMPPTDTPTRRALRALMRNWGAIAGLIIVLIILTAVIGAQWIAPYDPISQSLANKLQPPSSAHWLGTDTYGRDILSRILWGGQSSLYIGFASIFLSALFGTILGGISGYLGGIWDTIIMRIADAFFTFPIFLLALIVVATLGPSANNVIIAIALSTMPRFIRMVRAEILVIMKEEYVTAARVMGYSPVRILFRHVLPNVLSTVIVLFTVFLATAIMSETSLSFLGLGTQPPDPSWGSMIANSRSMLLTAPWAVIFPSLAITILVLALNLLGDGVRDAFDPRRA